MTKFRWRALSARPAATRLQHGKQIRLGARYRRAKRWSGYYGAIRGDLRACAFVGGVPSVDQSGGTHGEGRRDTQSRSHDPLRARLPDLALVRPPRFLLAELKTDKGMTTPSQDEWLALLSSCPAIEVYLWRPHDFNDVVEGLR